MMDISMKTVEIHAKNSMRKLDASNRARLILAAIREGIVPCPRREFTGGICRAIGESRSTIDPVDEAPPTVGQAITVQGLRAELSRIEAQLARAKDRAEEIRILIDETRRDAENGAL